MPLFLPQERLLPQGRQGDAARQVDAPRGLPGWGLHQQDRHMVSKKTEYLFLGQNMSVHVVST